MKYLMAVLLAISINAQATQPIFDNGHDNRSSANAVGTGGNASAVSTSGAIAGASANVHNTNTNLNVQGQIQGQAQKQGQSQSSDNSNSSNVTVNGDNWDAEDIPVSTAYAPAIQPTANCAIGISGGVQVMGFGGSFGTAYVDENCAALEKVRSVATVLQDKLTAEALMCQDVKYNKARMTTGRPCPVEQE